MIFLGLWWSFVKNNGANRVASSFERNLHNLAVEHLFVSSKTIDKRPCVCQSVILGDRLLTGVCPEMRYLFLNLGAQEI